MKIKEIIRERLDYRETKNWSIQDWDKWLDQQLAQGQVAKADWGDAKQVISRMVDRSGEAARNIYLSLDSIAREPYNDLYWDTPHGLSEIAKAEKTATKSPDGPFKKAVLDLVAQYKPLKNKLDQLKPMIVTASQQRDVVKKEKEAQKVAEKGAAEALVAALESNRKQYVEEAKKRANEWITKQKDLLANKGGAQAFPEPEWKLRSTDKEAYDKKMKQHRYAQWLDKMSVDRYVDQEGKAADQSYEQWIYKLVQKIGKPVTHADVAGDPWTGSRITVNTTDGETQTWYTQQIINRSKLGKWFHQFPTRKAK